MESSTTGAPPPAPEAQNAQNRRNQVMTGDLPEDFLRAGGGGGGHPQQQVMADERVAQILQAQQQAFGVVPANVMGRLSVSIIQAKLAKNYGLTKMDPYCRIRVGHAVFETPTAYNGSKNPRWNKVVTCYLPHGVDSMYLEIFDERSFTVDDRVAWAYINLPQSSLSGDTVDEWYPLSGRQGDEKEGMINLVLTFTPNDQLPQTPFVYTPAPMIIPQATMGGYYPPAMVPMMGGTPVYTAPVQQPRGPMFSDDDLKQVKDMFPNMDEEVIRSVMEANRGNKDATINALLSMTAD